MRSASRDLVLPRDDGQRPPPGSRPGLRGRSCGYPDLVGFRLVRDGVEARRLMGEIPSNIRNARPPPFGLVRFLAVVQPRFQVLGVLL